MKSTIKQYKKRIVIDKNNKKKKKYMWFTNSVLATTTGWRENNFVRENFAEYNTVQLG